MINTEKAIKYLNDQELFKNSYPEDDLQEHIARQMQKYADQQLILSGVSGSTFSIDELHVLLAGLIAGKPKLEKMTRGHKETLVLIDKLSCMIGEYYR